MPCQIFANRCRRISQVFGLTLLGAFCNVILFVENFVYRFKCQSKEEFPRHLIDVFYLLADYFFKNNEFPTAIKYYKIDLVSFIFAKAA